MNIMERIRAASNDLPMLVYTALWNTRRVSDADKFGTTSEWLMECRAERIAYQVLADYAY